jgi:hypothetical protein
MPQECKSIPAALEARQLQEIRSAANRWKALAQSDDRPIGHRYAVPSV